VSRQRELVRELDVLAQVQAELASIATRTDDRRRYDLIDLRRNLSLQITAVGNAADPFFASLGDPDLVRTYRSKFSRMRTAAALHQANWPAVRLGENTAQYQQSARGVREANQMFVAWMREALATRR
jgi:hypothetical protein